MNVSYHPAGLTQLRNMLFFVTSHSLSERRTTVNTANLLHLVQFTQLSLLTFNTNNPSLASSYLGDLLPQLAYLNIYPLFQSPTMQLLGNAVMTCLLVFILRLYYFTYKIYRMQDQQEISNRQVKRRFTFQLDLAATIMYQPMMGLALQALQRQGWGLLATITKLFGLFLLCSVLILSAIYERIFFNFTFQANDALRRCPNQTLPIILLMKTALLGYDSLHGQQVSEWNYNLMALGSVLLGGLVLHDSVLWETYCDHSVSLTYGALSAAYLWLNLVMLVTNVFQLKLIQNNVLLVILLGGAFVVTIFSNVKRGRNASITRQELEMLRMGQMVEIKVKSLLSLFLAQSENSQLVLASLLRIHYDKCTQPFCVCHRRDSLHDPMTMQSGNSSLQMHQDEVFVKHYLLNLLKQGMRRFPSNSLHMHYMYYAFEGLRLVPMVYQSLQAYSSKYGNDQSLQDQFLLYRLRLQLSQYIQNSNTRSTVSQNLPIENVIQYDNGMVRLRKMMVDTLRVLRTLWETIQEGVVDLGTLNTHCQSCTTHIQRTLDLYQQQQELNVHDTNLQKLMLVFMRLVIFDDQQRDSIIRQMLQTELGEAQLKESLVSKDIQIFAQESVVVVLENQSSRLGQIAWFSHNFQKVLGYDSKDTQMMMTTQLMPAVFRKWHRSQETKYFQTGYTAGVNRVRHSFAQDSHGFLFSCDLMYKVVPPCQIDRDMQFIAYIKKINHDAYMLCDPKGEILSVGKAISDLLNLSPTFLENNPVNLQLLAPSLVTDFTRLFSSELDTAPSENTSSERHFWLLVPTNLQDIVLSLNQDYLTVKAQQTENQHYDNLAQEDPSINKALFKEWLRFLKSLPMQFHQLSQQKVQNLKLVKVEAQYYTESYFGNNLKVVVLKVLRHQNKILNSSYIKSFVAKKERLIQETLDPLSPFINKECEDIVIPRKFDVYPSPEKKTINTYLIKNLNNYKKKIEKINSSTLIRKARSKPIIYTFPADEKLDASSMPQCLHNPMVDMTLIVKIKMQMMRRLALARQSLKDKRNKKNFPSKQQVGYDSDHTGDSSKPTEDHRALNFRLNDTALRGLSRQNIKMRLAQQRVGKRIIIGSITAAMGLLACLALQIVAHQTMTHRLYIFKNTHDQLQLTSQYSASLASIYKYYYLQSLMQHGHLNSTIYSPIFMDQQNRIAQHYLQDMQSSLNQHLRDAPLQSDLLDYLLHDYQLVMRDTTNQTPTLYVLPYQTILHTLLSAIQQSISSSSSLHHTLLFDNYSFLEASYIYNRDFFSSRLRNEVQSLSSTLISTQVISFMTFLSFILVLILVIYYERKMLNQTLLLFTQLSNLDVSFYAQHYKRLSIRLTSPDLEEDDLLNCYSKRLLKLRQKLQSGQLAVGLSRQHLPAFRLSWSRMFFSVLVLVVLSFSAYLAILMPIDQMISFFGSITTDIVAYSGLPYESEQLNIAYFRFVHNNTQATPDHHDHPNARLPRLQKHFQILMRSKGIYDVLSNDPHSKIISQTLSGDLCVILGSSTNTVFPACDLPHTEFVPNFYIRQMHYIKSNLNGQKSLFQCKTLKNLLTMQDNANLALRTFNQHVRRELHSRVDATINNNMLWVGLLMPTMLLFIGPLWVREAMYLHRQSRQVNTYILLIPSRLIRENQFLKVWLRRSLGIKETFYQ